MRREQTNVQRTLRLINQISSNQLEAWRWQEIATAKLFDKKNKKKIEDERVI